MSKLPDNVNIPAVVEHLAQNALDNKNPAHIRENYINTLHVIKNFCDNVITTATKNKR
jgi:hypothetical protein